MLADLSEVTMIIISLLLKDSQACFDVLLPACTTGRDKLVPR